MMHAFDIDIATKYGTNAAIILVNIEYWVKKNEANGKHFHDGLYWTYNSVKAFSDLFPYMTDRQISNALKVLKDAGIITTGNFNENKYDRTLWYAITKVGYSIMQKCKMENARMSNGNGENVEPIPYVNADVTHDVNLNTPIADSDESAKEQGEEKTRHEYDETFEKMWVYYGKVGSKIKAYNNYKKLSQADLEEIRERMPVYTNMTEVAYRKHLEGYLNKKNKMWRDEVIDRRPKSKETSTGIDWR